MDTTKTVLLVEAAPDLRNVLELKLQDLGFEVMLAAEAGFGLELARRHQPDLIICATLLPDERGAEMCRRLSTDPRTMTIPAIIIDDESAGESKLGALSPNVHDVVPRLSPLRMLRASIERAVTAPPADMSGLAA